MEQMLNVIAFILGLGSNALIIFALLSLKGKTIGIKKRLSILSLFTIIIFALIQAIGYRVDNDFGSYYFGFPAEGLVYRGDGCLLLLFFLDF
ncbi:hypothetical protein PH210_05550 [Paenibacillus sp. BSR1-1]|uniref:hypothetical protein n=1 Tax=Paenibacillus sp. BSR1-1 TaxID=3020845 RepID=UPI0025B1BFE8|nr:hypothetical protein [Paenibacillus sp. BSR1-1]MDN3015673.1 hypothetical protein [Paenibacillus sp. BSR1-1]